MIALTEENEVAHAIDLNHWFTPAAVVARKWLG